jgi:adenylate kinase family enzyme
MLILVRGVPGSGKSTYAKTLVDWYAIEADQYFVRIDGVYMTSI